jgi:hypothetical protein
MQLAAAKASADGRRIDARQSSRHLAVERSLQHGPRAETARGRVGLRRPRECARARAGKCGRSRGDGERRGRYPRVGVAKTLPPARARAGRGRSETARSRWPELARGAPPVTPRAAPRCAAHHSPDAMLRRARCREPVSGAETAQAASFAGGRPVNPLDAGGPARAISLPRADHFFDSPRLRSECFLAGASPRSVSTCRLLRRRAARRGTPFARRRPGARVAVAAGSQLAVARSSKLAVARGSHRAGPLAPR